MESKSNKKAIITVIVAIVVVIIAISIGIYVHHKNVMEKQEKIKVEQQLGQLNKVVMTYKAAALTQNFKEETELDNQFKNFYNTFESEQNDQYNTNLTIREEKNGEAFAEYLEDFSAVQNALIKACEPLKTSTTAVTVKTTINNLNALLSSKELTNLTNIYNNNAYVRAEVPIEKAPGLLKSYIGKAISKLQEAENLFDLSNAIRNS